MHIEVDSLYLTLKRSWCFHIQREQGRKARRRTVARCFPAERGLRRSGKVLNETPLPELEEGGLHGRYRTIRVAAGESAFWVAQYERKTLLKVEEGSGKILQTIDLAPLLRTTSNAHKAFGLTPLRDGALWVATSTGRELLLLGANGTVQRSWGAQELGLTCRYLLGTQKLENGHLLVSCGDYHLKTPEGHLWKPQRYFSKNFILL